jgi:NADH-quinone oxidoreductase subunit G
MSSDKFKIEVNGIELEARPGQMLIEVTDAADIYVPRFCYHPKLSVAANCRMCLVEVKNAPKPLPACATPVAAGMEVFTKSVRAIDAQKAVMEFLLINHPLDCPICDQGGECELQDIAMGFGSGISRYTERKRSVSDEDLGPLISTDMTRCIHCTRCVRFGQEIAGIQELGALGRGESMEIGTYIEKTVDHELSGNIIDVCPVGALNNKPYRYSARAWEMVQRPTVAPHDCLGSNIFAHVKNGKVKRVVPRENESVNETWAADRDRFSCEGIYAPDRLETPMVREEGGWRACSWAEALEIAAEQLKALDGELATLISPSATTEEAYLAARLTRHLGSESIDHRLRRRDFRQQELDPVYPGLGMAVADIEQLDAVLVIGSNLRSEVPLLAHRVRKAALNGANVSFINPEYHDVLFSVADRFEAEDFIAELARLVWAVAQKDQMSAAVADMDIDIPAPTADHERAAVALRDASAAGILLGQISMRHPRFAEIRMLAGELARLTGARLGYIPEGANSAGASLAGALPHRGIAGRPVANPGANIADIVKAPPRGLVLVGVEPFEDCADGDGLVESSEFILALSPWLHESLERHANIVLPIGTFAETAGSFINAAGVWQNFEGVVEPWGESRPGWKVLRVLGNLVGLPECEYESAQEICAELRAEVGDIEPDNRLPLEKGPAPVPGPAVAIETLDVPMYRIDALVRRAESLQLTAAGRRSATSTDKSRKIA